MKNKRKVKLTDAQKFSSDFELLSQQIVEHFFEGSNAHIKKTHDSKDGGYDIIVECSDGNTIKRIYFECKLRSDNLNLRDIAANLIIAFNERAVALGIITNYDYTEQANENIVSFYEKAILNVKIFIGEDIQKLATVYNLPIPDGLRPIISAKKTTRKKEYQFLRIDYSQSKLYEQLLKKQSSGGSVSCSFITRINSELYKKAKEHLLKGNTICIKGLLGSGKTSFIRSVLSDIGASEIHVVADNYTSQPQLLLGIFLDLWGIPMHNIVREFSDSVVDKIISTINEKSGEVNTGSIVKHLFQNTVPDEIAAEHYNSLVCQYLICQLLLNKEYVRHIFYIENAEQATEEVQILLGYICKLLIDNHIGCVLERNDSEYQSMESDTMDIFYNILKNAPYYVLPIPYLDKNQAQEFVRETANGYPEHLQESIQKKGGVRLLTLTMLIEFVKERWKQQGTSARIMEELQAFTPNDVPNPVSSLLDIYFQETPDLFLCFSFFQGKIPIEWLEYLVQNCKVVINRLLELNFLIIDDDCLVVANELFMEKINTFPSRDSLGARLTAQKILSVLKETASGHYVECKIAAYCYLKQFDTALTLLADYMEQLWKERQYTSFLKYVNEALSMIKTEDNYHRLQLLISGLKVWIIKKQANSPQAMCLLTEFKKTLCTLPENEEIYYRKIYDYFNSKRLFKNCDFDQALAETKPYYDLYLQNTSEYKNDEWIEKLCIVYALSVKELSGNEAAMSVFSVLYEINPESFHIQLEYLSHQQCMNFYIKPELSRDCINKIMDMFRTNQRDDYPLPFHEYVDQAMCALCAKYFDEAMKYSDEAIRILESNGIMPTLGRAYNIKGCTYLCMGNYEEAGRCFKEACFIMDEANYNLFSWRSRLNLIQLEVTYSIGTVPLHDIKEIFNKTYLQFKNIYQEKVKVLSETPALYTSREYFALLMFGDIAREINIDIVSELKEDFLTGESELKYLKHLQQLKDKRVKHTEFTDCPYSVGKYLFMVG